MTPQPMVKFDGVTKRYGTLTVLDELDLEIRPGEKVAIIGPSGSGKTTVLRMLMTLEKINDGVIWVDGAWSNAALEALIQRADALVSLHRAEGFGRNIAKALLLGRPVVVTDWSGNADMRAEPGYFGVKARLVPLGDADYVLGHGQHWAEPDGRDAVRQLRAALRPRPRPGRERAALRFSRQRLARRLGRILQV